MKRGDLIKTSSKRISGWNTDIQLILQVDIERYSLVILDGDKIRRISIHLKDELFQVLE